MGRMQITQSPLADAGRRHFSPEDAATWVGLLRPGFHLRARDAGETVVGYLGGEPLLPEDVEWPVWDEHGPLAFIGAFDCGALPAGELDIPLPADGALLFFYFDGQADDGDVTVDYLVPETVTGGARVLYVPADADVDFRTAPEKLAPYPRLLLSGDVVATAPDNEHAAIHAAYGDPDDPTAIYDHPVNSDEFYDAMGAIRRELSPHHQIGGYAFPVQGAVENEAAHVLHPGKEPEVESARKALAAELVLLAQIDSDARTNMSWGDAGILYWLIHPDDLAAGRFEAAAFTWQCG
jgi:uncharacterized protein YwqG